MDKLFSGMALILYFVTATAASEIAARRRIERFKLAYVPVVQNWVLGSIADHYDCEVTGNDRCFRKKLMGWMIAQLAVMLIGIIAYLIAYSAEKNILAVIAMIPEIAVSLVYRILLYRVQYRIYKSCVSENAVWMLILSILIPIAWPIMLFCIRNKDNGYKIITAEKTSAEGEMK